jgi:hypothetical protein
MSVTSRPAVACVVALSVALAAGCGDDRSTTIDTSQFPNNRRLYAMPLDQIATDNVVLSDYAENLLVQPCMKNAGFAWPVPAVDPNAPPSATLNDAGRRLFNVDVAARFGYHRAPSNQPNAGQIGELNTRSLAARESASLKRCSGQARRRLPRPNARLVFSLSSAAYEAAQADAGVIKRATKWHACMAPRGVSDLPAAPTEMPSPSLGRRFGLDAGPGGRSSGPTPDEIGLATADARCRESSGYAQAFYAAERDRQLKLIGTNQDALSRVKDVYSQHASQVRAVIARSGT